MRPLDIDPRTLPVHFILEVDMSATPGRKARDVVTIRPDRVSVKHELSGVSAVTRDLDLDDFSGIAIRIDCVDDKAEGFVISVNLHHPDPKLCFPLFMSTDMELVNARWQSWGRVLKLPLLLPSEDGQWREPIERFGKLTVNTPFSRPSRLGLSERRSCISSVREVGDPGRSLPVEGEELIARA